jgi:integrase
MGDPRLNALNSAGDASTITETYRQASKSGNTERSYRNAVDHYRFVWGGKLPASPELITHYLSAHAKELKVSTLRQRLAALASWHRLQGFPDPTRSDEVKEVMRGIAKMHQTRPKQAHPLTFRHLTTMCDALEFQKVEAIKAQDQGSILRIHRDLALLLIGFWQGFRSDELSRLVVQNVIANRTQGMSIFLPHSKTDKDARGKDYNLPALRVYCPVSAYLDWIQVACLTEGPVFKSINRWGQLAETGINKQSIEKVLNRVAAGMFPGEPTFSTHSLRRGFADWAANANWDLKSLMDHVGWSSAESARRYLPVRKDFGALAIKPYGGAISNEASVNEIGQTLTAPHHRLDDPI